MSQDDRPTGQRLPPLNALKAFEASARHLNLSMAARELSVTPGAISQQIRLLEDHAGGPLFKREGRNVVLTDLGKILQPMLTDAFEQLKQAAEVIYGSTRRRSLTVSVPPSFAAKWLIPRVSRFAAIRPDIEVWISADMKLADVGGGRVDVAVRYGRGDYAGVRTEHLMDVGVIPVCSPEMLKAGRPFLRPAELRNKTLIHVNNALEEPLPDWGDWFESRGLSREAAGAGPRFDQTALAVEAAAHGRGLALAPQVFVAADLASKRLIAPIADGLLKSDRSYWTVTRRKSPREEAGAFTNWLASEARSASDVIDDL